MKRTQIYLPENQVQQLQQIAYKEDLSVSEIIRRVIGEKLAEKEKTKKSKEKKKYRNAGEWLLSMAKEAERRGFKGPKDLASNVDKYLYGGK